jgi:hypothetical protein
MRTSRYLFVVVTCFLFFVSGCNPTAGVRQNFFPPFTPQPNLLEPPQDQLLLWLEGNAPGGGSYLVLDANGDVERWHDVRGGSRQIVPVFSFEGRRSEVDITTPAGITYRAFALNCGDPNRSEIRCSYVLEGVPTDSANLDGRPYTILAVVRRNSGRGDNYFVMTGGRGCNPDFGGTGCESNTALHVGWSGERTIRLGQYDNDVIFDPAPAFNARSLTLSLFVAISAPSGGKTIGLLEPSFNVANTATDTRLLTNSSRLFIGGTAWGERNSVPDWRFVGDIVSLLIYTKQLSTEELRTAEDYLRNLFGPA